MIVVRPVGELSDLAVVLAVSPDLVHHGVCVLLREEDGLGHVVIVILQNDSEVLCVIPLEPKILHLVYLIKDQFIPSSLFDATWL